MRGTVTLTYPLVNRCKQALPSVREGLAPRTVAHTRAILRNALSRAVRHGLVARNAAELAEPVAVPNAQRRILSPEQARVLRESYRGDRLEALHVVAMTLGLRMSELLGLRWEDIGLADVPKDIAGNQYIAVRQTVHRVGGRTIVAPPKTPRSRRDVPLSKEIADLLYLRRIQQKAELLSTGARPTHDLVFTTEDGRALNGSAVTARFKTRLRQLGLPAVSFHDLRHVAASNLQARGLTLVEVQAILGHASITTTANVYTHSDDGVLAAKVRGIAW